MWDKVVFGFDLEEETANFGTRRMAVCDTAIFEANTMAVIINEDEGDNSNCNGTLHVMLSKLKCGVLVVVNECVILFDDICSQLRHHYSFNSLVDCFTLSQDFDDNDVNQQTFLFVGLSNGDLHCLHLESNESIFLQKFSKKSLCNKTFANIFLIQNDDKCELFIVCYSGDLYYLKEFNLRKLKEACLTNNKERMDAIVCAVEVKELNEDKNNINANIEHKMGTNHVISVREIQKDEDRLFLLLTESDIKQKLQLWSISRGLVDSQILPHSNRLRKIEINIKGCLIYGLTKANTLLLICLHTLIPIAVWTECNILDFVVMNDEDERILCLSKNDAPRLQLVTVPCFETKFQLDVNKITFLTGGQSSLDELLYLEAYHKNKDDILTDIDTQLNIIHVKSVTESQPEYRLDRILKRGKFEKAEEFAKLFNLNIEIVYKAEVQHLMNKIQPWVHSDIPLEERGNKLMDLLKNIQDVEYIGICALNAISDFAIMKTMLLYSEERIKFVIMNHKNSVNNKLIEIFCKIKDTLLRLNTFLIVEEKPLTAEKWLSFCKTDLLNVCQLRLKQGEIRQAILIWTRHNLLIQQSITMGQILYLLRIIPSSVSFTELLEWLKIFLPNCLTLFPTIASDIVIWSKEKVNLMELRLEAGWPECGVHFLKGLLQIINPATGINLCSELPQKMVGSFSSDPIKNLLNDIEVLTEILVIKKDHRIDVSIAEYTQANQSDIIFNLLDKVPSEQLESFMNQFLERFMLQRGLNSNVLISEYIQSLVEGSFDWWYWEEAPWENRVSVLLNCIHNMQEKLSSILRVLKHAPVPWSAVIQEIFENSLKIKNPLISQIREQKKMVDCKLILKKYDLKHNSFTKSYIRRVLLYIFAQAHPTMLQDALQITNTFDEEMQLEVYDLYVKHLITNGESEKALAFLDDDSLSAKTVMTCCENIVLRVYSMLRTPVLFDEYKQHIDILDAINGKLQRAVSKLQTTATQPVTVISPNIAIEMKNIYNLQTCYNIEVSSSHLCNKERRLSVLKNCLQQILKNLIVRPEDNEKEYLKISELSSLLDLSRQDIFIEFIHLAITENQMNIAFFLVRYLLQLEDYSADVSKKMIELGARFLQRYICGIDSEFNQISMIDVRRLVIAGLINCSSDLLCDGIEISNWCHLLLSNNNSSSKHSLKSMNGVDIFPWSNSSIIRSTLLSYNFYLEKCGIQSVIRYTDEDIKYISTLQHKTEPLEEILSRMPEQEQELVYFKLTTNLHWSLFSYLSRYNSVKGNIVLKKTKEMTGRCVSRLLKKLVSSRKLDFHLGLALLNYFSIDDGSKWISEAVKSYKHDFHKLHGVTELGMAYYQQNQLTEKWNEISKVRKQCEWGKKIMEFGISYKEAFREFEYDQLLMKLIAAPSITLPVLCKFCKDMNFDYQECLKLYLKNVLTNWEPELELVSNLTTGDNDVVIKQTYKKLEILCREVVSLIRSTKDLFEIVALRMWDTINYYHYEVFSLLISLLEESSDGEPEKVAFTKCRTILMFLSSYRRVSEPQQYEKDLWFKEYPNTQSLPQISKYRLPFTLLTPTKSIPGADPWKILKYELNINTYKKWFSVLDALGLDKNMLCTIAINQIASNETINYDSSVEWNIHLCNHKFLSDIKSCVGHITNLEMASASLYYVVNHLPPGADQLAAASLCYLQAQQWHETEKSEKSKTRCLKVHKKYLTISTTHILYVHNIGKHQYLQLVLQPVQLIHAIYYDPVILLRNTGELVSFPDINKAVDEIGELHGINVTDIKSDLLEEWLQPENFIRNGSFNESITINVDMNVVSHTSKMDHENFLRACYVLETNSNRFGPYLAKKVFDHNYDDPKPVIVRLRSLYCLYTVLSEEALQQLTNSNIGEIRQYMTNLLFITELESIDLTYSLDGFIRCDKQELVQLLLRRNGLTSIRLATRICRTFNIETSANWNTILSRMISFNMLTELCDVLPDVSAYHHLLDFNIFESAWKTAITLPFTKSNFSVVEDHQKAIERSIQLLYSCPITDRINLSEIKELCSNVNRNDLVEKIQFLIT